MRFPGPSKNDLLRSRDRFRTPKSRRIDFFGSFLAPPWILRDPKILQNRPGGAKNVEKKIDTGRPWVRSWKRARRRTAPEHHFG